MKRFIALFVAIFLGFGLVLVACQQAPTAPPMTAPDPDPDPPDPDPDPDPDPVVTDLNLNLLGWSPRGDDDKAGTFTWDLKIAGGDANAEIDVTFSFEDGGGDVSVGLTADPFEACDGLGRLNPSVSGRTVTFDGTLGAACALVTAAELDETDGADELAEDDKLAFEITLAALPMTAVMEKPKDQKIKVTGMVTITRGTGDDAMDDEFDIRGSVTYKPPMKAMDAKP